MRILIFILALMSAFFVPKSFSIELDLSSLVPPKSRSTFLYDCVLDGKHMLGVEASITACFENTQDAIKALYPSSGSGDSGQCQTSLTPLNSGDSFVEIQITYQIEKPYGDSKICGNHSILGYLRTQNPQATVTQTCPPDGSPEHKYEYKENPENESIMCAKLAPDCPAGYHSKGTSRALGSQSCVPKDCPPTGSSESLFSSPTIGGVPFDGGGLYCNDGCAYNVNESQISLGKYAIGVSQGIACGDKPYDNKKLADDANADQCTTATDGTVSVLQCPDYNQPEPETDPINNDASKVDDSETPLKEKESCAEGDTTCNLKNVETEIENSITRQMDNDNELHNKKIEADEKNAKAFLNVMESIDTAILMQTAQDDRFHAITVGKFNELIDAVNGIETGGGGGGGGNGTGNGNIGGQDCEGTIEECAGIGSGDGVELPQETRNLEQYAQKYNNWLPDAELPPEKCITLTNGKSLCFSFTYFILFFQAISGLIVISSLIHSASIIVRSV